MFCVGTEEWTNWRYEDESDTLQIYSFRAGIGHLVHFRFVDGVVGFHLGLIFVF